MGWVKQWLVVAGRRTIGVDATCIAMESLGEFPRLQGSEEHKRPRECGDVAGGTYNAWGLDVSGLSRRILPTQVGAPYIFVRYATSEPPKPSCGACFWVPDPFSQFIFSHPGRPPQFIWCEKFTPPRIPGRDTDLRLREIEPI